MEYSIGELSRMARMTVKALRFYHEQGLLEPARIDGETGYRYYDEESLRRAEAITWLRGLDCSIQEIRELLASVGEKDEKLAELLRRKGAEIAHRVEHYRRVKREIDMFLSREREMQMIEEKETRDTIQEKTLDDILIAGLRFRGRYDEIGKRLGVLAKLVGRVISGGAFTLYYDGEYKEEDADLEVAFPVRRPLRVEGVECRVLKGGRAVTVVHRGHYEEIGRSYRRVIDSLKQKGLTASPPSREVYLKGPGMFFSGNPKKYLTEIQVMVDAAVTG